MLRKPGKLNIPYPIKKEDTGIMYMKMIREATSNVRHIKNQLIALILITIWYFDGFTWLADVLNKIL